jgi:hypothetical protein
LPFAEAVTGLALSEHDIAFDGVAARMRASRTEKRQGKCNKTDPFHACSLVCEMIISDLGELLFRAGVFAIFTQKSNCDR